MFTPSHGYYGTVPGMQEVVPQKIRVHVVSDTVCECGYVMLKGGIDREDWTIRCLNKDCKKYNIKYEIPTFEVNRAEL